MIAGGNICGRRRLGPGSLTSASLTLGLLAGCTPAAQDELARDAARATIRPILAERFPGVPLEGATDCIIDNASAREIVVLGTDAATGPTVSSAELVLEIATRPEAVRCLITEGTSLAQALQ